MPNLQHMSDTAFPNVGNVNVYRYSNDFDYSRWTANAHIKVCNVPWCGDYENVVKFDDDAARDAWFDTLEGDTFELDTMVHNVPEQTVKLPIPAPVLQAYNYLVLDLPPYTSEGAPVENVTGRPWKRRFFYFIDNVVYRAASTTECRLRIDYWTTYINDILFEYAILARGHAPVAASDVDDYLSNPLDNSRYLLAPDVTFAQPRVSRETRSVQFDDGDSYAVILTAATFWDDWGDLAHPRVPSSMVVWTQGACGNYAIAIDSCDFETFFNNMNANCPQFLMAIKGVFFISKKCVGAIDIEFSMAGVRCYQLDAAWGEMQLIDLNRTMFDFPAEAAGFAKLYTYPYSELVVTDATGAENHIRIEDTTGRIDIRYCVNLILPWVSIDTQLTGIGGTSGATLTFENIGTRTWRYSGAFWDTVRRYEIPVYSVTQSAYTHADYTTDYLREQEALAASNAKASADASANTANSNATDSANTAETNTNNSASNLVNNTAISTSANSAVTATKNAAASEGAHASNANTDAATAWDNSMTTAGYQAQQDALAVAATNNDMQAGAAAVSGIATGIASVGASIATGNIAGAVGSAVSAVGSLAGTAVGWSAANASNAVSQSNSDLVYNATISANTGKMTNNTAYTTQATNIQNDAATTITNTQNGAQTSIASNNAATMNQNAANTRATAIGNANRTLSTTLANNQRTYDTTMAGIQARLNQAGVAAPVEFGARANGDTCVTRPLSAIAAIVTQPTGAIMQAASQFARYGYQLNQQWHIDSLQVMKHFTYWECAEVWCAGNGNTVETAQQAVKDIMTHGVTVWSDPDEIGTVSIYDN